MRCAVLIGFCLVVSSTATVEAEPYVPTQGNPMLLIQQVTLHNHRSQPLGITFELAADGKGPVAVSQKQLSLHISTHDKPYLFISDLRFPNKSPDVFVVTSTKPATLSAKSSDDRFGN